MTKFAGIVTTGRIDTAKEITQMLTAMTLPEPLVNPKIYKHENFSFAQADGTPFIDDEQNYFLTLHGRIYNGEELKKELIKAGQTIKSEQIESLILLSFQTWGVNAFGLFNGAFTLFIFDKREKKMTIARDRLGSKSLFWGRFGGHFIFANQLKGILSSNIVSQTPALEPIASYFFLGYFPLDKTPVKDISRLLPGYYIQVDEDENIVINKYWSFMTTNANSQNYNLKDASDQLDQLMKKATRARIQGHRNTACYLNGEIGSTAAAYYYQNENSNNPQSFSLQYEGINQAREPFINLAAQNLKFSHQYCQIKSDQMLDNLQRLVWHLDEPIADPRSVPLWRLAKKIKSSCSSVITGLGSKEFLGNRQDYSHLAYQPLALWFLYLFKPLFLKGILPGVGKINKKWALGGVRFFQKDFWSLEYIKQQALFSNNDIKTLAPNLNGLFDISLFLQQSYQYLKTIFYQDFSVEDYLFYDAETTLSNYLLVQYENIFSSEKIELLCPYFDKDVLDYILKLPENIKTQGKKGALPLHHILEKNFKNGQLHSFFPSDDIGSFFSPETFSEAFSLLSQGVLVESDIISKSGLKKMLQESKYKPQSFRKLWAILILEIWFNLFINNPIRSYPQEIDVVDFLKSKHRP